MQASNVGSRRLQNPIGGLQRLAHLQGVSVSYDLEPYRLALADIEHHGVALRHAPDAAITARARDIRCGLAGDPDWLASAPSSLPSLATPRDARSACGRSTSRCSPRSRWIAATSSKCRPARGRRSRPSCRRRFAPSTGQGAHVLTFNDYLARRDAEWMGPVYAMLGLSVGFVQQGMTPEERRRAYLADVTYVTAKEAGFDHLRDLLAMRSAGAGAPAVPFRARGRSRLAPHRRGARAAGHRRQCRSRDLVRAAAGRARGLAHAWRPLRQRRVRP